MLASAIAFSLTKVFACLTLGSQCVSVAEWLSIITWQNFILVSWLRLRNVIFLFSDIHCAVNNKLR